MHRHREAVAGSLCKARESNPWGKHDEAVTVVTEGIRYLESHKTYLESHKTLCRS